MKIKGKIFTNYILIVFIVLLLFLISIFILTKNIEFTEEVQKVNFPRTQLLMELQKEVLLVQLNLIEAANTRGGEGYDFSYTEAQKYFKNSISLAEQILFLEKNDKEIIDNMKVVKENLDEYYNAGRRMVDDFIKKGTGPGSVSMHDFDVTGDKLITSLMFSVDAQKKKLESNIESINTRTNFVQLFFIIAGAVITAIAFIAAFIMANIIVRPLNSLLQKIKDIATGDGDLTSRLVINTKDELYDISVNFNQFVEKIQNVVRSINEIINELAHYSKELSLNSLSLSENTQSEAASVEEITATVEEISAGMENITDNTARQFSILTSLFAKMDELTKIINGMENITAESSKKTHDINEDAKTGKETLTIMNMIIQKIEAGSIKMRNIISMISDISDRINLLSLNAAIESARAGDAGRGFAVVADEISKLADQTASSIHEIDSIIKINSQEIVIGLNNVSELIHKIQIIIDGVSVIDEMMGKIKLFMKNQINTNGIITSETEKVKKLSDEIKIASNEQKTASIEIVRSISTINELIQTNAAGAEETAGTSQKVSAIADNLKMKVEFFKI